MNSFLVFTTDSVQINSENIEDHASFHDNLVKNIVHETINNNHVSLTIDAFSYQNTDYLICAARLVNFSIIN